LMECTRQEEETERFLTELGYRFWAWDVAKQMLVPAELRQTARLGDVIARVEGWPA